MNTPIQGRSGIVVAILLAAAAQAQETDPPTVTDVRAYDGLGGEVALPGTVDFAIDTIVVTFSEEIDPATVNEDTIRLVRSGGDGTFGDGSEPRIEPVSVTLSTATMATVDLTGVPLPNDTYQITVRGDSVLAAGLAAHWTFDEGAGSIVGDSSGNGNNGTIVGGATWVAGRIGGALNFDGSDDRVDIGNPASLGLTRNFSIAGWISPNDIANMRAIVSKTTDEGFKQYGLRIQSTGLCFLYEVSGNNYEYFAGSVTTGWRHVAATIDGGLVVRLYIDGSLVGTDTAPAETQARSDPVTIGRIAGTYNSQYFFGLMDDLRIYDRVLDESEIGMLANEHSPRVADLAGNALDGDGDTFAGGDFVCEFTVDAPLPEVQSITPAPDEVLTSVPTSVTVTFTKDMDASTVNEDTIRLVASGGDGTFVDGNEVVITPAPVTLSLSPANVATMDLSGAVLADDEYQVTVGGTPYPTAGLIAHWRLDEGSGQTVADHSLSGLDGVLGAGTDADSNDPVWATGPNGAAVLDFDGIDDRVDCGDILNSMSVPFSVAAWVKLDGIVGNGAHIIRSDIYGSTHSGFKLYVGSAGAPAIQYGDATGAGPSDRRTKSAPVLAPIGVWFHLAGVVRGPTDMTLHVDGVDVGGTYSGAGGAMGFTANPCWLGAGEISGTARLDGQLRDVRVFGRALTQSEVDRLVTGPVTDLAGNPLDGDGDGEPGPDFVCEFTLDTTPPTVVSTSPADGATIASLGESITVTFSEPMDETTLLAAFSTSPGIAGTPVLEGNVLTLTPLGGLASGTTYTVTISTVAEDPAGHALESPCVFSFTLEDDVAPYVVNTSPLGGATDVPLSASITVTFSELMAATATEAAFSIDPAVGGTPSVSGAVLTLVPSGDLESDTQYTITIGAAAADLVGLTLAADYTFTFSTEDLTAPAPVTDLDAIASSEEIELRWRNPFDVDFAGVVILRSVDAAPSGSPADGTTYAVGNVIGNGVVLHVGTAATGIPGNRSSWTETGLEDGREYHYAVFAHDEVMNYSPGVSASAVPGETGGDTDTPFGGGCATGERGAAGVMLALAGILALARRPRRRTREAAG